MARLLAAVCLLHVLGGARGNALGNGLFDNGADLWQQNTGGGCSGCRLDKMVKSCPLDVMFLLDMSESIPPITYEKAREYTANQMKIVSETFQDTHVGLLAFSEVVHHDIPLKQRNDFELNQLTQEVLSLPQERYGTELADTLRRARRALTNHSASALVPGQQRGKIIVLVSDGCEDDDRSVEREGVQAVLDGIYVISVALSEAYLDILKKISVQILELRTDIDWQSTVACPSTFLPPVDSNSECANVVVAMDGSDSVRRWEHVMRDYLAYTSMRYDYVDNAMGVVVFGTNVNEQSTDTMLPPTKDKKWLADQIENYLEFPNRRGTGTTAAIQVSTAFLTQLADTTAPLNAIVIITDGPALNPASARQALASAVAQGFKVVVIGVGNLLTQTELQTLAGPTSIVLRVDSYLDLYALDLSQYICRDSCNPVTCPPGQFMNETSCECARTGRVCNSCPIGYESNPDTCACVCARRCGFNEDLDRSCQCIPRQCTRQCNSPLTRNSTVEPCRCECRRTCPSGQRLTGACNCEPICSRTCNSPFQLNTASCQCECRRTCPSGQRLTSACLCECSIQNCPAGLTLNTFSCQCERICTEGCEDGFFQNPDTCQCECRRTCPFGQRIRPGSCECEPTCQKTCNGRFQLDRVNCQCVCPLSCGFNEDLDRNSCQCIPRQCNLQCPSPLTRNSTVEPCRCECRISCPFGKTLNPGTCTCLCPQRFCPAGQTQDPNTCECVCQQRFCPAGQTQDSNTCECVCPQRFCPAGQTQDPNTCGCVCPQRFCPAGQTQDSNTCGCVCQRTCPADQIQDPNTCRCVCPQRFCPAGQTQDPNTCGCVCPQGFCPAGQTQDPNTCGCDTVCPQRLCPAGQTQDPNTCECVCQPRNCPNGQTQNPITCGCDCTNTVQCSLPYVFDERSCGCVPCRQTTQCAFNEFFDEQNCKCVPRKCAETINCGSGTVFNSTTCKCDSVVCQERPCNKGFTFDTTVCDCVVCRQTTPCPSGTYFDEQECTCVPNDCNNLQCNNLKELDPTTCTCRCRTGCAFNENQDPNTCACIPTTPPPCTLTCPFGFTLDTSVQPCRCVCQRNCPAGFTLNRAACSCECPRTCSVGETLDRTTCSCVPDSRSSELCTAAEAGCYNNQNAYKDCEGRCICNCDASKYAGSYCDITVNSAVCDNCTFNNGHYIAPVAGSCDMFFICQPLNGGFNPILQHCAPGTILKRVGPLLTCIGVDQGGVCPVEPCQNLAPNARYAHSSHCAKYWQCDNGVTVSEGCCPQGQGFDKSIGQCVDNNNCPNNCAEGFRSCNEGRGIFEPPVCPYLANPANRKQFFHREAPWAMQPCAPTDFFNETSCHCDPDPTQGCVPYYDVDFETSTPNQSIALYQNVPGANGQVGYFSGDSRLIMHRFGGSGFYFNYLEISLRVRLDDNVNFNTGREMALVSNGDCEEEESLGITVDGQSVFFKVTPEGSTQAEVLAIPYSQTAGGWLEVLFQYEKDPVSGQYTMTGTVNGRTEYRIIGGRIDERVCALQLGHGLGYDSLRGYVDDFQVWTCKPTDAERGLSLFNSGSVQTFNTFSNSNPFSGSNTQNQASSPYNQGTNTYSRGSNTQNRASSQTYNG